MLNDTFKKGDTVPHQWLNEIAGKLNKLDGELMTITVMTDGAIHPLNKMGTTGVIRFFSMTECRSTLVESDGATRLNIRIQGNGLTPEAPSFPAVVAGMLRLRIVKSTGLVVDINPTEPVYPLADFLEMNRDPAKLPADFVETAKRGKYILKGIQFVQNPDYGIPADTTEPLP